MMIDFVTYFLARSHHGRSCLPGGSFAFMIMCDMLADSMPCLVEFEVNITVLLAIGVQQHWQTARCFVKLHHILLSM
jgi:hypothetical protein